MTCPNGHPADGSPCVAHSCERRGTLAAALAAVYSITVESLSNSDGLVELDAARLRAGVEDCLPWCEACRGLGEYRQGPARELRPCGYCSDLKRHP